MSVVSNSDSGRKRIRSIKRLLVTVVFDHDQSRVASAGTQHRVHHLHTGRAGHSVKGGAAILDLGLRRPPRPALFFGGLIEPLASSASSRPVSQAIRVQCFTESDLTLFAGRLLALVDAIQQQIGILAETSSKRRFSCEFQFSRRLSCRSSAVWYCSSIFVRASAKACDCWASCLVERCQQLVSGPRYAILRIQVTDTTPAQRPGSESRECDW